MTVQTYFIRQTSAYIKTLLPDCHIGTVHSVYHKTINLRFGEHLISLQAKYSPLSPISLITDLTAEEMEELHVTAGIPVSISHTEQFPCIHIGSTVIFSLQKAAVSDLKLNTVLSEQQLQVLETHLLDTLSLRNAGSFELLFTDRNKTMEIPFLKAADLRIQDAKEALQKQDFEKAVQSLGRLVGLGLGLTPGGDDFICGILAGIILCNTWDTHPFSSLLRQHLALHLNDTNDISSTFLRCALEGQFSLAVNVLPQLTSPIEIFRVFSEIGHSSGTDTLCGIYFLLKNRTYFKLNEHT